MILALDVGNTNITCGVFDGDRIKASFRITTKMPRTSDEYGMLLSTLLERNQVGMDDIHDAIICSVVPNIMHSLQNGLIKYFNIRPIIVEAGIKTGIRIATPNPQQIGADRIVDAVAAYELYGGPVLVIDLAQQPPTIWSMKTVPSWEESQHRAYVSQPRHSGRMQQSFLR